MSFMPADSKPWSGRKAIIIGAGLGGSLLACYLSDLGFAVDVYERRPDPRAHGYAGGRSINLALSVRGITGLAGAGLADLVMRDEAIRMPGRLLHAPDGSTRFQPYSSNPDEAINSVSRGGLNCRLLDQAQARPGVRLLFEHACLDVDLPSGQVVIKPPASQPVRVAADAVFAVDGAFSAVRLAMMKTDRFEYSQTYLAHGYKELHIPPLESGGLGENGRFAMEPHALHIWPRGSSMMIALPNRDASFTCTLFWPFRAAPGGAAAPRPGSPDIGLEDLTDADSIRAHFAALYPDALRLMPTLVADYQRNPNGSLVTVRCWPWQHGGRFCLLGDAAHAIVPFYGQGMNAAFEDCRVLADRLAAHARRAGATPAALAAALDEFQHLRKPNADAIADMAIENFVEMRDLAGRADFQHRKKIEQALHAAMGEPLTPQYNLVSFSNVPYAEAQARGRRIARIVADLADRLGPSELPSLSDPAGQARLRQLAGDALSRLGVDAAATPQHPRADRAAPAPAPA